MTPLEAAQIAAAQYDALYAKSEALDAALDAIDITIVGMRAFNAAHSAAIRAGTDTHYANRHAVEMARNYHESIESNNDCGHCILCRGWRE